MSWQTIPIDRKVAMTTLVTTSAALILTAGSLIGYELLTFKRSIHEKIDLLGRIVASNSTAALAFRSEDEAEELLGSLRTEADITGAALYDAEGELFVTYPPHRARHTLPIRAGAGSRFTEGKLELFVPAVEAGVPQGTLYLEYDLASLLDRARLYAAIVAIVAALSLVVAWFVASRLQRSIAGPILSLVRTAQTISHGRDYSVRAQKWSDDDIGLLTDAFNHMLDRTQAMQAHLQASEAKYLDLFENAPDMYLTVEAESGRILDSNRTLAAMLGMPKEEIPGSLFRDLFDDASQEEAEHALRTLRAEGSVKDVELVLRTREGRDLESTMNMSAVRDDHGRIIHGRVVLRDNRERKRAERELRHYANVLARSNQDLDDFAYAASHDLRAPLRAIDSLALWIEEDLGPNLTEEGRRHLQRMRQRVDRMDRLLDDLLQYSRVGRTSGEREKVDVHRLTRELIDMLAPAPPFRVTISTPLPTLITYRAALRQVILNLVSNAIKHHDRPDGHIAISARDCGQFVEFEVADDGPGIPAEHHERVFKMFQTLKPRDHKEASGIGLALVKKAVEVRGGRVTLRSSPGGGATFAFTWPKVEPEEAVA